MSHLSKFDIVLNGLVESFGPKFPGRAGPGLPVGPGSGLENQPDQSVGPGSGLENQPEIRPGQARYSILCSMLVTFLSRAAQ